MVHSLYAHLFVNSLQARLLQSNQSLLQDHISM